MTDNKDDGSGTPPEEPEVIIVPPEDQDVIPPENTDGDVGQSGFADTVEAEEDKSSSAKTGSRTGMWIAGLVVVAFVAGFIAWPKLAPTLEPWLPESLKPGAGRIAEVTKALDELALRIATLKDETADKNAVVDLGDRLEAHIKEALTSLAEVQKQIDRLSTSAEPDEAIADQLSNLANRLAGLEEKSGATVADLVGRIDSLEARPATVTEDNNQEDAGQSTDPNAGNAVDAAVAGLRDRLSRLEEDIQSSSQQTTNEHSHQNQDTAISELQSLTSELAERLASAESRLAAVASASTGGASAVLVAAAGQLRSQVESGKAYTSDLEVVKKLAATDQDLQAIVAGLQKSADGLPALAALKKQFASVASEIVAANRAPADNWMEKVWQRLSSLVTVRRTGEVSGDDAGARVARAEQYLATNNLAAAVAEMNGLADEAAKVAVPWLQQAQRRLDTLAALDQLTRLAVQRLASPAASAGASE